MNDYNPDSATIRQQWKDLRHKAKSYNVQELRRMSLRWPGIELRHPPAKDQMGWWMPSLLEGSSDGKHWRRV
jgi:hypothetical protein